MSPPLSTAETVEVLVRHQGQTFAAEAHIRLKDQPSPLFRLLCLALLLSARISSDMAVAAARALVDQGWTTPTKMRDSTWRRRTDVLNASGYARYDESTSRMLGYTTGRLLDRFGGDLRRLRSEADRQPDRLRALLKDFKGIGDVGADIFCREVQGLWDELHPFADHRVIEVARALGLGDDAGALRRQVESDDQYLALTSALVRVGLARDEPASIVAELASKAGGRR